VKEYDDMHECVYKTDDMYECVYKSDRKGLSQKLEWAGIRENMMICMRVYLLEKLNKRNWIREILVSEKIGGYVSVYKRKHDDMYEGVSAKIWWYIMSVNKRNFGIRENRRICECKNKRNWIREIE